MKFYISLSLILVLIIAQKGTDTSYQITSFLSKEETIPFRNYSTIFNISINRDSSTTPDEPFHCKAHGRNLQFIEDDDIFKFTQTQKNISEEQALYESLTTLDTKQKIVQFELIDKTFYVVTSQNIVYFMEQEASGKLNSKGKAILPAELQPRTAAKDFFMLVVQFSPVLIYPEYALMCQEGECKKLEGWVSIPSLTHAVYLKTDAKKYILLGGNDRGFSVYELTPSNKLEGPKVYGPQFFGKKNVSIFDITVKTATENQIYVLDYFSGLYSLKFDHDLMNLKNATSILSKVGCYAMDSRGYQYLVLNCLLMKSNYLLELHYNPELNSYSQQKPSYKYETIIDVEVSEKYYVSRGYSGFKFYWASAQNSSYPEQYRKAGEKFLPNSVESRFKKENGKEYLYFATFNQIGRYQIQEKPAYATCISDVPTEETYTITYSYPCPDYPKVQCKDNEKISYSTWKHSEISISKAVIPTVLAFVGAITILCLIRVFYKRYKKQEEQASIRYATSENEFGLQSNR